LSCGREIMHNLMTEIPEVVWRIKNHLINERNWDYVYKPNIPLVTSAGRYEFRHIAQKEGFPILFCEQVVMYSWIARIEETLFLDVGTHIVIYKSARYWITTENVDAKIPFDGKYHIFNEIDFSQENDMTMTREKVEFAVEMMFNHKS
jgi:hypothetical protein